MVKLTKTNILRTTIELENRRKTGGKTQSVLVGVRIERGGWFEALPVVTACQPSEKGVLAWMVYAVIGL